MTEDLPTPKLVSTIRTLVRGFLIALLLIGANISASIIWERYNPAPRIVSVDLNSIVREHVAKTAKSDISDEEKRKQTEAFAQKIDNTLQGLAVRQNTIILTSPAVIAGSPDITQAVKKGLVK